MQEELEEAARDKGMLDIFAEICNDSHRKMGVMRVGIGAGFGVVTQPLAYMANDSLISIGSSMAGAGIVIEGLANYIMRTDNPPPRKDFIRRGFDKLTEIVSEYTARIPEPALLRNPSYLSQ